MANNLQTADLAFKRFWVKTGSSSWKEPKPCVVNQGLAVNHILLEARSVTALDGPSGVVVGRVGSSGYEFKINSSLARWC